MEGLENLKAHKVETPFGLPSSEISIGEYQGVSVAFLPRHGQNHSLLPSEINYRANIWALKYLGVRQILSVSAVGSLRFDIQPGDLAVPNQYFDWIRGQREKTFFGSGVVAHISTAEPVCPNLSQLIHHSSQNQDMNVHFGKTYACVDGPRLGTRAESLFLQNAGCDLVGMTNVPEVFLAREAQICYSTISVVTDYDCWLDDPNQHATVDKVIELYHKNINKIQSLIKKIILDNDKPYKNCGCREALKYAIMTSEQNIPLGYKKALEVLKI